MVKKLSCVSHGSLKRFPHTFTTVSEDKILSSRNIPHSDFPLFDFDNLRVLLNKEKKQVPPCHNIDFNPVPKVFN